MSVRLSDHARYALAVSKSPDRFRSPARPSARADD